MHDSIKMCKYEMHTGGNPKEDRILECPLRIELRPLDGVQALPLSYGHGADDV
jgi:hypothetical protein